MLTDRALPLSLIAPRCLRSESGPKLTVSTGYAEIVGDVVPRDRQGDMVGIAVGQTRCHFEDERADLLERGDAAEDQELTLQSRQRRECDLADLARDLPGFRSASRLDAPPRIGSNRTVPSATASMVASHSSPIAKPQKSPGNSRSMMVCRRAVRAGSRIVARRRK